MKGIWAILSVSVLLASCGGTAAGPTVPTSQPIPIEQLGGETGVSTESAFSYDFDTPVDCSTVTDQTCFIVLTVEDEGTANISFKNDEIDLTGICNPENQIGSTLVCSQTGLLMTPDQPLEFNTGYTVCMTTGIKDQTGEAILEETLEASFVTEEADVDPTYTIGGTVSGLGTGDSVVLQNSAADDLTVSANGAFTFATALSDSAAYVVTVFTNPTNKECSVSNGSGSISTANVTNVGISCSFTGSLTAPSLASIRTTLGANNASGMVPDLTFGSITLPECTQSGAESSFDVTYALSGTPSWLSFSAATRAVTLASGTEFPGGANTAASVTYSCTADDDATVTASQTFTINDLDGGGIVDGLEYQYGEVPLLGEKGWAWLNPTNLSLYRAGTTTFNMLTLLPDLTVGLDPTSALDEAADFDGDDGVPTGGTNAEEIAAGTNPFVYATHGTFTEDPTYDVAGQPWGMAVGDLDNDGFIDVVAANVTTDNISVLINDGDGTFAAKADYATGSDPLGVAIADYDGDGFMDVAISHDSAGVDTLTVHINDGDGTFTDSGENPASGSARNIVAADLDNDGVVDLATADSTGVDVFIGDGDGTFAAPAVYPGISSYDIAAADFDRDGFMDLVVTLSGSDQVGVLINDGDGTFAAEELYSVAGETPRDVTFADYDGDGYIDLATADTDTDNISVLVNDGDGTFGAAATYATTADPWGMVSGDVDGDGDIDIVATGSNNGDILVFLNDGDGVFAAYAQYQNPGWGPVAYPIALADIDNNGTLDIVGADTNIGTSYVYVFTNP